MDDFGVDAEPMAGGFTFVVGDRKTGVYGHEWRAWVGRTSFYVAMRKGGRGGYRVSLHGPDPRINNPGWLFHRETREETPGWARLGSMDGYKRFPGETVAPGVTRVFSVRVPYGTLNGAVPHGAVSFKTKTGLKHGVIRPPERFHSVDVDFYVSDGAPYWPHREETRRERAGLGPLRNEAGQILTAVSSHRSLLKFRLPPGADDFPATSEADAVRGSLFYAPDGMVYPVAVENLMSRRALMGDPTYRDPSVARMMVMPHRLSEASHGRGEPA